MIGNWRTKDSEPVCIRSISTSGGPLAGRIDPGAVTVGGRKKGKKSKNRWTNAQKRAQAAQEGR